MLIMEQLADTVKPSERSVTELIIHDSNTGKKSSPYLEQLLGA